MAGKCAWTVIRVGLFNPAFQQEQSARAVPQAPAAMVEPFPELFNEAKPDYELVESESLTAYVQFESFPEEVFPQKFHQA